MGDRTAHRPPAAGLVMADMGKCRVHQRQLAGDTVPPLERALPRGGADFHDSVVLADIVEIVDAGNVDQHRGLDEAEVEHRHERQTAGEDARLVAGAVEARDRLLGRHGADIVEGARFHRPIPSAASKRCHQVAAAASASGASAGPPARTEARRSKNCRTSARAAPSIIRPPIAATVPDTSIL